MDRGDVEPRLAAALDSCDRWALSPRPAGAPRVCGRLSGGHSNESWLIAWGEYRLVVRLDGVDSTAPGMDRREEASIQGAAARAGLAPTPRHADAGAGLLVSDYLAPAPAPEARGMLAARGALLRAIHALDTPARRLDLAPYLDDCEQRAGAPAPALAARARRLLADLAGTGGEPVLCHNDLTAANRLWHDGRLLAVDWEYAARGSRWFDLAAGCDSTGEALALLDAYRRGTATAGEAWAVAAAFAVSRYVDALWYTIHHGAPAADWAGAAEALELADV